MKKKILSTTFALLFLCSFNAFAQGISLHLKSGERVDLRMDEADSITIDMTPDFVSKVPVDTVVLEKRDTVVMEKKDTVVVEKKDTVVVEKTDTIVVEKTDTVVVEKTDTITMERTDTVYLVDDITIAQATVLNQHIMTEFDSIIPPGNYSGIYWLGENRYAMISDKQKKDGWFELEINLNDSTGDIESMKWLGLHATEEDVSSARDAEGIVYCPYSNSLFISAESDQQILEYDMGGLPTGRGLAIPEEAGTDKIFSNYGFEALTYSPYTKHYWTTTEQHLKMDGTATSGYDNRTPCRMRLMSFDKNLQFDGQWPYLTDAPTVGSNPGIYAFGVPELTALPDGSLLVLEREFVVPSNIKDSCYVKNKIYHTKLKNTAQCTFETPLTELAEDSFVPKTLVAYWRTDIKLSPTNTEIANYEGMCLGPKLPDGRQTLLLVSDSQDNYGMGAIHLYDFIRVVVLDTK